MVYLLILLIGVVAGLRALTAPAVVSWAAFLGWIDLSETWAGFMGAAVTPWIFSILAIVELVTDQLPNTPSRKVPMQFGARLVSGGFCGAVLGAAAGNWSLGLVLGVIGAAIGTYGGAWARGALARGLGSDRPAALIEDAVAILGGFLIVWVIL